MSTVFSSTTTAVLARLKAATGITLPSVTPNDNADGLSISSGFIMVDTRFRKSQQVTINHPVPKLRHFGSIEVAICTPINEGVSVGLIQADKVATLFSCQRFSSIYCYAARVDSPRQILYAKGEYWNTPVVCNFYTEEYITVG